MCRKRKTEDSTLGRLHPEAGSRKKVPEETKDWWWKSQESREENRIRTVQCHDSPKGEIFIRRGETPLWMNHIGQEAWRLGLVLPKSQGSTRRSLVIFTSQIQSSGGQAAQIARITQHVVPGQVALWHYWDCIQLLSAVQQLCIWTSTVFLATLNGSTLPTKEI